nr:hypothetical protein [Kitasatospora sp. K002]
MAGGSALGGLLEGGEGEGEAGVAGGFGGEAGEGAALGVGGAEGEVEDHLAPGVGGVLDGGEGARVAFDAGRQAADGGEGAAGEVVPAGPGADADAGDEGGQVVGGEDLGLLDDLAVGGHRPAAADLGAPRAQGGELRRPREVPDRRVVDAVVALVQRAFEQVRRDVGGVEELRGEGAHEDVRREFLHERRFDPRLPPEGGEFADQRVGQEGAREGLDGEFAEAAQGGAGGASAVLVESVGGHRPYPGQFFDPYLSGEVQQQE